MRTRESDVALPFTFVDYASSPQDALAKDIIALDKSNPSDLSQIIIWCESRTQIHTVTQSLINAAKTAGIQHLLLPTITSLQDWVWQQDTPAQSVISETNKQLLLVEAIRQSPSLFQTNNAWPLAKELVNLFNECTLAQIPLQEGEHALREMLQKSYRYPTADITNISRESEIVYRLWRAYREQIEARGWIEPIDYYCRWLIGHQQDKTALHYFVVGKHRLCAAEAIFLQQLAKSHHVSIYSPKLFDSQHAAHHHPHLRFFDDIKYEGTDCDTREQALDIIYDRSNHTYDRIQQLKSTVSNNIFQDWLSLYTCNSIESHVSAVCLQAKKWLIEEKHSIGIVVNDRLLARRIRAVLEEQGIQPTDLGGWTLSTTSAATSIEVLLDAIERNFKKDSLLDLLSSPFLLKNTDLESPYPEQVFELRKLLKKHRNTASDSLESMIELTTQYFETQNIEYTELRQTLEVTKSACTALQDCQQFGEYELSLLSDLLISALKALGIYQALIKDNAGKQLIDTLETHIQSTRNSSIKISWKEWRQWLRDLFEHNYFIPEGTDKRVTLCGFEHTDTMRFNAVIIAGVEENRLTNSKNHRTFFNEKVCHELRLPTSHETNAINFVRFRQLLQQSNAVLLSAEIESHGEPQEISSWVKLLNLFCEQTYASSLENSELEALIQAYKEFKQSEQDFTENKTLQPQPTAPAELIPTRISATQYQSLIDCPYQYFAKYVLELRDQETADDFEASDFGMLVHQSLYEFHFSTANKTTLAFNTDNRDMLNKQLSDISTAIFMHAAFPKAVKQGWLQRWLSNAPAYIEWALQRAEDWRAVRGESAIQTTLNEQFTLYGKIDRIDSDTQHFAVVDYKTGSAKPSKKNVMNGELVQLPFYALLDENIIQAEYLSLASQGEVKASVKLDEQVLTTLKSEHKHRLESVLNALLNETKLNAQGDEYTCERCDYHGLCRKEHWN